MTLLWKWGMFVQSMKFIERHNGNKSAVSIIGQEKNPDTRRALLK